MLRDGPWFYACPWCGSRGDCEHLVTVVEVADNPPIPVRARGGLAEAQQRTAELFAALAARALGLDYVQPVHAGKALLADERGEGEGGPIVLVMFVALIVALLWAVVAGWLPRPDPQFWLGFLR